MKNHTLTVLFAFLMACSAPEAVASPVTYTIKFTTTSGIAPTSGSFSYDSSDSLFSSFTVLWDGETYDLTASANNPVIAYGCVSGGAGGAAGFVLMSEACSGFAAGQKYVWSTGDFALTGLGSFNFILGGGDPVASPLISSSDSYDTGASATGGWSITESTATPEPASAVLVLVAILTAALLGRIRASENRPVSCERMLKDRTPPDSAMFSQR